MEYRNDEKAITSVLHQVRFFCEEIVGKETLQAWFQSHVPLKYFSTIFDLGNEQNRMGLPSAGALLLNKPISPDVRLDNLNSILSNVNLRNQTNSKDWIYSSLPLGIDSKVIFPKLGKTAASFEFMPIWNKFSEEIDEWKTKCGNNWETQSDRAYLMTLLALIRKYFWCVSASICGEDKQINDASLFENIRLGSAISVCLEHEPASVIAPVLSILRGDISGIQSFIYRIVRPENDTKHLAKRLRGRSFYLSMLTDVIVDWMLNQMSLPPNCILFSGGGRFDLILPIGQDKEIQNFVHAIEKWMLQTFHLELGLQFAQTDISINDLRDMRRCSLILDSLLEKSKQKKWSSFLTDEKFFVPGGQPWHACQVCKLTELSSPGICDLCKQHESIGKYLPHITHLAFCYGEGKIQIPSEKIISFNGAPFTTRVALITNREDLKAILDFENEKTIFKLNSAKDFILPATACTFRFLANSVAIATEEIKVNKETISAGEVLSFEAIAELSQGAKNLGILKMDVDHLGLVISEGLVNSSVTPQMARVATLSSHLDLFFAGYLNQICRDVFEEQKKQHPDDLLWNSVSGIFYIIYSGGDDLFIVGPWDAISILASRIHSEFSEYCGQNPDITISAGIVIVNPRFPVQKFAELVRQAEHQSKKLGRNKITIFNHSLAWQGDSGSYETMCELGKDLWKDIQLHNIPSGLIYDLGRVYRQHQYRDQKQLNPMWTPRLYYTLARRLSPESREKYSMRLIQAMKEGHILIAISLASLLKREEK